MATAHMKRPSRPSPASKPRAYSYIRFSTPEQAEGDSERRQIEQAEKWAQKHGHTLDDSLRADRGFSGFSGAHRKKGNLGKFLARVEAGDVPRGSILIVEELRRLTREGVYIGLKETIFKLFDAGITLQTLGQSTIAYNTETIKKFEVSLSLTMLLQLAHEESKQKSEWGNATWRHKRDDARAEGKILTSVAPEWLEREKGADGRRKLVLDSTDKPIPIKAAVKSIRLMFEWKDAGIGYQVITQRLNAEAPWSPKSGWGLSYVKKVLRNRSVIGEYQPHRKVDGKRIPDGEPINDYFPAIVERKLFLRVQRKLAKSKEKSAGGRTGNFTNVFRGLVKCAYCGGAMYPKPDGGGRLYLYCENGRTGKKSKCKCPQIQYPDCERAILDRCLRLRPEELLPKKAEQTRLCESLRKKLEGTQAEVQDIESQIDNYNSAIGRTKDARQQQVYEDKVIALRDKLGDIVKQSHEIRHELEIAERAERDFTKRQADMATLCKAIADKDNIEVRERLNAQLHEFIDRIEVFSRGYPDGYNDDDFGDYLAACEDELDVRWKSQKVRQQFVSWAVAKRHTKAGRFLRIHFKLSPSRMEQLRGKWGDAKEYVDVTPESSIAGRPNIGPLLEQFKKTARKRSAH